MIKAVSSIVSLLKCTVGKYPKVIRQKGNHLTSQKISHSMSHEAGHSGGWRHAHASCALDSASWLGLGLGLGLGSGLGLGLSLTVTLTLWDDCAAHALHVASAGACPSEVYGSC